MNKDSIFKKFINSIYNPNEVYRKYIKNGIGKAIVYALLLCLILGGIKGGITAFNFNNEMNETITQLQDDKYKFEIANGELSMENSPIKIDENDTLLYMDDDKSIGDEESLKGLTINADTYALMLKDGIIIYSDISDNPYGNKVTYTYKEIPMGDSINNEDVIKSITFLKIPIIVLLIIVSLTQEFINYLILSFLIAMIFVVVNKLLGFNLKLGENFSFAIYLQTLPLLLVTAISIVIPGMFFDMANMVGTSLYIFLTLKNIKQEGIN